MATKMNKDEVLANLTYFTEWGGRAWVDCCRDAIQHFGDIRGKTVLEIGPRYGKMSVCFALLGAKITGIDTVALYLNEAEAEAKRWGVEGSIQFLHYDGNFKHCQGLYGKEFDIVFTKSVLVKLGDKLYEFLVDLSKVSKPGTKFAFIENRHGGPVYTLLRRLRTIWTRDIPYTGLRDRQIRLIETVFHVTSVKRKLFPPLYVVMGERE